MGKNKTEEEQELQKLIENLRIEDYPQRKTSGGQSTHDLIQGVKIICQDTNFEVACCFYRGKLKNRDKCIELYKIYIQSLKTNNNE